MRARRGHGGMPLPDTLRRRLERAFAADLSAIRLHRCTTARRLAAAAAARACAADGAILLGERPVSARILAHEVAHLLQARLPGPPAPVAAAEAEAHRAAPAALAGHRIRLRHSVDPARPMAWEEAGHYYTVYFVGLAAGIPDERAHRIAFWAQFPDEVSDLDAVKAGFDIPASTARGVGDTLYYDTGIGPTVERYLADLTNEIARQMGAGGVYRVAPGPRAPCHDLTINLNVQMGLHCLTGRDWDIETNTRERISLELDLGGDDYDFGLSLHCFGDSFAHRNHDSHRMYPPVIGHGLETKAVQLGGELARAQGLVHTDSLGPHRRNEYAEYVRRLYNIFAQRFPGATRPRSEFETVQMLGTIIAERPNPTTQIAQIRDLAAGPLGLPMNLYEPERWEDVGLLDFHAPASPVIATYHHVARGHELAARWTPS